MTSVSIIGIGSPMGLDRIGWEAAQALQARGLQQLFPGARIRVTRCDRPGSRLVTLLEESSSAILIDALQGGTTPGEVHRFTAQDLAAYPGVVSSHDVGVAQALALGAALGQLPPRLVIYGIEIGTGRCAGEQVDTAPLLKQAVVCLYRAVCDDIQAWLSTSFA